MDAGLIFEKFVQASTFRCIQQTFFQLCCALDIHPCDSTGIYKKVRQLEHGKLYSKAGKLWTLLDKKWNQTEYCAQKAGNRLNVLIVGAGPCGLRAAIECALLGAHVVVVEQREKFSRNNVLHLWNFVIQDLKSLGAKIFFPKFCTGSIEHISIRRLQCILLKVALLLGVQVYGNVSFVNLIEPSVDGGGWTARLEPQNHVLSDYEFNVLIGADGKRNMIPGFPRKVVRGKLAIGITANFVNNRTPTEEKVSEISGVAYIFNQSFFNEMLTETGIDLENIVYYKDDTHYFVMSAKKQSLLKKGVIRQDFEDISMLLSKENVDQEMLCKYAAQAADFATNGKLPQLTFSRNVNSESDVALFDFTALSSAVYCTRILERRSRNLIISIVGDSLHEPFWPTGSGCARGFLSVFDTAWMLRSFGLELAGTNEIVSDRENVYKMLAQTTKENLCRTCLKYTIDPKSRYKQISDVMGVAEISEQIDTDLPRVRLESKPLSLCISAGREESKNLSDDFSRRLRLWLLCYRTLLPLKCHVVNFNANCWGDGKALVALIHRFRPNLIDASVQSKDGDVLIGAAFSAMASNYALRPPCSPNVREWSALTDEQRAGYINSVVCVFFSDKVLVNIALLTPATESVASERRRAFSALATNAQSLNSPKEAALLATNSNVQQPAATGQTRQPSIKKLNPATVEKIGRMISGSYEKEQLKKLHDEKSLAASITLSIGSVPANEIDGNEKTAGEMGGPSTISKIACQLNVSRGQKCPICGVELFLAEQVCLKTMLIHKRCLNCSQCKIPLQIDNCTIAGGARLYCGQHAYLSRNSRVNATKKPVCPSVGVVPAIVRENGREHKKTEKCSKDDALPSQSIALHTMQRIRWRGADADDICAESKNAEESASLSLAKRETDSLVNDRQQRMIEAIKSMKRNSTVAATAAEYSAPIVRRRTFANTSPTSTGSISVQRYSSTCTSTYGGESDASSIEDSDTNDELWAEFVKMLEGALTDNVVAHEFLNEHNLRSLIEKFNRRQTAAVCRRLSRPSFGSSNELFRTPAQDASVYFTPKSSFPCHRRSIFPDIVTPKAVPRLSQYAPILNRNDSSSENEKLSRSNQRGAAINIDVQMAQIDVDHRNNDNEVDAGPKKELLYSTTKFSEPTSGVLLRKHRRDRLKSRQFSDELQDVGKLRRARSHSSANFSTLLSSFRAMLNEDIPVDQSSKGQRLPMTPENVFRAKRSAQALLSRREKEQQLNACQIQRSLDETESRIDEVRDVSRDLERRLYVDPRNEWLLENWVFYAEEMSRLKADWEVLSKRAQLIRCAETYQRLRDELHAAQSKNSCNGEKCNFGPDDGIEKEQRLTKRMLDIINERKVANKELKQFQNKSAAARTLAIEEIRQILADKQYDCKF